MKRLGSALLALLIGFSGVAICARGVQACTALQSSSRDCCTTPSIALSGCCCPAKQLQSAAPAHSDLLQASSFNPFGVDAGPTIDLVSVGAGSVFGVTRSLAPPDTPTSLRTSLLL